MSDIHDFAAQLGEREPQPVALIGRIVRRLGHVQAGELLDRTLALEAEGGMLTSDGDRRRTAGGVFLALVKQHLEATGQAELALALFPPRRRRPQRPAAAPTSPPPVGAPLRPRRRAAAPAMPSAAPDPLEQPASPNHALALARRLLTAEMGCYALGAHQETQTLRARFAFPDAARAQYAEQFAAAEQQTGWRVELHPQPHQGQLAQAALQALPPGLEPAGPPSLHQQSHTVVLRARGAATPEQIAAAQQAFHQHTGWALALERVEL